MREFILVFYDLILPSLTDIPPDQGIDWCKIVKVVCELFNLAPVVADPVLRAMW
jgi:hypothetical protein